jgi:hypothetical protein
LQAEAARGSILHFNGIIGVLAAAAAAAAAADAREGGFGCDYMKTHT